MSSKPRYYLGGPMTGIPFFNFPVFDAAATILRAKGYDIVSPAELDDDATRAAAMACVTGDSRIRNEDGELQTWGDFLSRDVKIIADTTDGIILLPGWETSKGALLELAVSIMAGNELLHYNNGNPTDLPPSEARSALDHYLKESMR